MIGKALGDQRAEHPLDRDVDLGDEIDRALLVDLEVAGRSCAICRSPARTTASMAVVRKSGCEHSGVGGRGWTRLTMRISMPPSGARCSCTSSMKLRMRKMPRPLDLSRFSGRAGRRPSPGSKPSPWSRTRIISSGTSDLRRGLELDEHVLRRVVPVAVLDGVDHRLADRDADPVQRVVVEADVARHVVADHLHEVEHLERAGELEPDDVLAVCRHVMRHAALNEYHLIRDVKTRGQVRKVA